MITRATRIKLIVFVIVAILGVGYGAWRYAGGDRLIGHTTYTVPMKLGDTGGIFTNAEVSYRGVSVGRVGDITLTDTGLIVDLEVQNDAPPIPRDVTATVANRSAVGEQYVNLVPKTDNPNPGQWLRDVPQAQRTIEAQDTVTPPPTQKLLGDVNGLATSVPLNSLRTVVDELYTGTNGTGGDLQRILDTAQTFTSSAQQNLPATRQLLDSGRTVLSTQAAESGNLKEFASNLRGVAATLKGSDADLRNLIQQGAPAAAQVNDVINENGQNLSHLFANSLTTSELLRTRNAGLEQVLVTYPVMTGAGQTILEPNGNARLGLALNLFNPPPCVKGYETTVKRPAADTNELPANYQAYCAEPPGSPIDVRGSQNAPFAGRPVSVPPGGQAQFQQAPAGSVGGVLGIVPLGPGAGGLASLLHLR